MKDESAAFVNPLLMKDEVIADGNLP